MHSMNNLSINWIQNKTPIVVTPWSMAGTHLFYCRQTITGDTIPTTDFTLPHLCTIRRKLVYPEIVNVVI